MEMSPYQLEWPLTPKKCHVCNQMIPGKDYWTETKYKDDIACRKFFHKDCAIEYYNDKKGKRSFWFR